MIGPDWASSSKKDPRPSPLRPPPPPPSLQVLDAHATALADARAAAKRAQGLEARVAELEAAHGEQAAALASLQGAGARAAALQRTVRLQEAVIARLEASLAAVYGRLPGGGGGGGGSDRWAQAVGVGPEAAGLRPHSQPHAIARGSPPGRGGQGQQQQLRGSNFKASPTRGAGPTAARRLPPGGGPGLAPLPMGRVRDAAGAPGGTGRSEGTGGGGGTDVLRQIDQLLALRH